MVIDIKQPHKPYEVVWNDAPWQQSKGGKKAVRPNSSGLPLDYQTQTLDEIKEYLAMVNTTENAVLFLWTIEKYLVDAQRIAEELGWKLHIRMIWDKTNGPCPAYTVSFTHEYMLWMYRGKFTPIDERMRGKIDSVFREPVKRHSQKPEVAYKIVESFYPTQRKLEMYARQPRKGWDAFGNEVQDDGAYQMDFTDFM